MHGLLIILGIAFISYTIYTFTKPKIDTKLYAAIINNPINLMFGMNMKAK